MHGYVHPLISKVKEKKKRNERIKKIKRGEKAKKGKQKWLMTKNKRWSYSVCVNVSSMICNIPASWKLRIRSHGL